VAKTRHPTFAALPLSEAFYAYLARTGKRAGTGPSGGGALADAVAELSRLYTREREELATRAGGQSALGARLEFFLPRDLVKMFGPLDELWRAGQLPSGESLRVLDVGAGLGATSLGLARWLKLRGLSTRRLQVTALERNRKALGVFQHLCAELKELEAEFVPIHLDARAEDVNETSLEQGYDVVLFGFVLNELFTDAPLETRVARRAELLLEAARRMRPGGALIVLEPALKETTRELMCVRDVIAARKQAPYLWAPCVHAEPCPMLRGERDWCHQELAYALPPRLALVAQQAGLRWEGLSYASLILGNTPRVFETAGEAPERLLRVVSQRLESKGKLELFGCGQEGYVRLTRLERDRSPENARFGAAERGDVLHVQGEGLRIGKATPVR
jgi:SAM-dependent methyltransferase